MKRELEFLCLYIIKYRILNVYDQPGMNLNTHSLVEYVFYGCINSKHILKKKQKKILLHICKF